MANIALINDTTNNLWTYSPSIDKQTGNILILNTANKFLDKNIKITPSVTAASGYSLSISDVQGNDPVTIGAVSSGYYPITVNNLRITGTLSASIPGWFSNGQAVDSDTDNVIVGKIIAGTASTPATTITTNPTITINSTGLITASYSGSKNITPTITAGYITAGTAGKITTTGTATLQLSTQGAATITPGPTSQVAVAAGKYTIGVVTVAGVPLAAGCNF